MGVMTEVVGQIHYANGVNFDPASRTLYVSEHLAGACWRSPSTAASGSPRERC